MSSIFELAAEPRTDVGKGASRRLRREKDLVPAIVYGGDAEPASITIPHKDISRAMENKAFGSHILTLKIGSDDQQVILKTLQRHPAKDRIMHADFLRVRDDKPILIRVPIRFINETICPGVKNDGGVISHILVEIEVSCLPKYLPEVIEIDLAEVELGQSVHLNDVTLPEGVSLAGSFARDNTNPTVISVQMPKGGLELEDEEEGEEGEGEAVDGAEAPAGEEGASSGEE